MPRTERPGAAGSGVFTCQDYQSPVAAAARRLLHNPIEFSRARHRCHRVDCPASYAGIFCRRVRAPSLRRSSARGLHGASRRRGPGPTLVIMVFDPMLRTYSPVQFDNFKRLRA